MDEEDKKAFMEEFKKGDGAKRLEMWDYALQQQVLWENIIVEIQKTAREQGVDKQLEKWPDDYTYEFGGDAEETAENMGSVIKYLPLSGFIIVLLFGCDARCADDKIKYVKDYRTHWIC